MPRKGLVAERSAADFLPPVRTLEALRAAAQRCRGCDLYKNATQAVLGEGPEHARLVLVGEQPGNQEDLQGRPFVGPAGRMLDRALAEAGFERSEAYVTNAVKHFKWRARGKLRIHAKPDAREIRACRPWFEAELEALEPDAVVALGATAAQSLFGPSARVTVQRGSVFPSEWARCSSMTVHPSSLLRIPEEEERRSAFEQFVRDLRVVRNALQSKARNAQRAIGPHANSIPRSSKLTRVPRASGYSQRWKP